MPAVNDFIDKADFPTRFDMPWRMAEIVSLYFYIHRQTLSLSSSSAFSPIHKPVPVLLASAHSRRAPLALRHLHHLCITSVLIHVCATSVLITSV
jgi:hypothetical protein